MNVDGTSVGDGICAGVSACCLVLKWWGDINCFITYKVPRHEEDKYFLNVLQNSGPCPNATQRSLCSNVSVVMDLVAKRDPSVHLCASPISGDL